jgi:protein-disulfide isomerase
MRFAKALSRRSTSPTATRHIAFSVITLCLIMPFIAQAQSGNDIASLAAEIEALKQGQQAIQKDVAEIKQILQQAMQRQARARPPEFKPQDISIAESPFLGEADAPLTLVEFTDYQCPFCRRHALQTQPQLVKDYVETGRLKYVIREYPIQSIHPQAVKAAEAALCVNAQGKYWEFHDTLFQHQKQLQPEDLKAHAEALNLDMAAFEQCLDSAKTADQVRRDLQAGMDAGVRGTPSFFLGFTKPDAPGAIHATKMLRGAQPFGVFQQTIDGLLAEVKQGS